MDASLEIGIGEEARKVCVKTRSPSIVSGSFIASFSKGGVTFTQATLSCVTCIIGAGIMALPMLPMRGGWVLSSLIMAVCCYVISVSGCEGICSAFAAYNEGKADDEKIQSYDDLGRIALGQPGLILVTTTQSICFIGVLAGYTILISEQLEGFSARQVSAHTWKSVLFLPLAGLSCLRDMTAVAKLIPTAVFAAVASCLLICVKAMLDSSAWADWETDEHGYLLGANNTSLNTKLFQTWPTSGMALGSVTGIIFGAYSVNGNVPSIMVEMRDPSEMPKALRFSLGICLAIYLCVMLMGHYGYGNFVQDNLLDSMTRSPANAQEAFTQPWCWWTGRCGDTAATMMQVCVFVNLVISFPLLMLAVVQSVRSIESAKKLVPSGSYADYIMRIAVIAIVFGIAFTVDNFALVFGFFCSVCGPLIQTVYPIVFGYLVERSLGIPVRMTPGKILSLTVASFCIIVGFCDSVTQLMNHRGGANECAGVQGHCASDGGSYIHAM
eukprot:TRINITY_DN5505_c0_g1_i2.p1 TRINITY_DN5505_c0_g1~~TRINITY_DN5505_c0_g1_i2.p1  ORF type:complete len:497 (-),score=65.56 TRINITY_DN5505_c0_g1_i2:295-1785(-)